MTNVLLKLSGLSKTVKTPFSRKPGFHVGPLDLQIEDGEIVGLLGANGAGKTTTLKMLLGLLVPDGGRVELVGQPTTSNGWRSEVGYLPEQPAFYDYLSGREFLLLAGQLFGLDRARLTKRAGELLERVGIAGSADRPVRTYSKGMLQRLGIAQALLNDPKLLIMDEPMSGLDPLGRRFVRDLLLELREEGKAILFSTHIVSDAEFVCDRVALMRAGQLSAVGTFDELLGLPTGFELACVRSGGSQATAAEGRVTVKVEPDELSAAIAEVLRSGSHLVSVSPIRSSIEDLLTPGEKSGR